MRLGSAIWRTIKGAASAVPFLLPFAQANAIVCPSGQITYYEVEALSVPSAGGVAPGATPGPVGRKYDSLSLVKGAFDTYVPEGANCGVAAREWWKLSNVHPTSAFVSSANGGTYTHSYRRECSASNGGGLITFANVRVIEKCQVPVCNTQPGTDMGLQSLASYNRGESTACLSGCVVNRVLAFEFTATGATPASGHRWQSSGTACSGQTNTVPSTDSCRSAVATGGATMTGCAVDANKRLLSDGKRPNDKTPDPNDVEYSGADADTLRDEGCVTTASGRVLCISTAAAATKPNNGTPGTPATPDAVSVYSNPYGITNNSTTTIYTYNNNTVNASTNYGVGAPPIPDGQGSADGDGSCEYGENVNSADCFGGSGEGEGAATCGGPDLPSCKVKIDETDVSDAWEAIFDNLQTAETDVSTRTTTAAGELATSVAANNPGNGWSPGSIIPTLETGACRTIDIEFFGGQSKAFPPPYLCAALENYVKPLLAFFLYVITAGLIVFSGIRSMTGNT